MTNILTMLSVSHVVQAIIVGGVVAVIKMIHVHDERLAKIERGIDPDGPWPQQRQ